MNLFFREIAIGLLRAILAIVIGTLVGALLFGAIDWMRTFQSDTIASSVSRTALQADDSYSSAQPFLLALIAQFVDWYSTVFFGYSRFGAGLFMMAGGFWAVGKALSYGIWARGLIGFVVGSLIGVRVAMFILSRPVLVLGFAAIGGVLGAVYAVMAGRASRFSSLPKLQLKHQS